mgnify:CR=1 FL=1
MGYWVELMLGWMTSMECQNEFIELQVGPTEWSDEYMARWAESVGWWAESVGCWVKCMEF